MPRNQYSFVRGHPYYPPKGPRQPRQPSIRQQRAAQVATLARMISNMSAAAERGEPVNAVDFTRLIHLQMRLQAEL